MARTIENAKYFQGLCWKNENSPVDSIIIGGFNGSPSISVSPIGSAFLLPNSIYKMLGRGWISDSPSDFDCQKYGKSKEFFLRMAAGIRSIHLQIRSFSYI